MTEGVIINIESLSYKIKDKAILNDINLKVRRGSFLGLIGPNGAGKTTLLKCLNGINKAKGKIELEGKHITHYDDKELARKVALLNQNTQMTFPFPSKDIVLMGRFPYIKPGQSETKEDYKVARESMVHTDTIGLENAKITEVSGGERQRVLFAKTLAQETDILLLDEPTASLDIQHEQELFALSKELVERGKTVVAAVHDLRLAMTFCTELALIKEGQIIKHGSVEEVMTEENLKRAYNMDIKVYWNEHSKRLDYYIP